MNTKTYTEIIYEKHICKNEKLKTVYSIDGGAAESAGEHSENGACLRRLRLRKIAYHSMAGIPQ